MAESLTSRPESERRMNRAMRDANLVGVKEGLICVWSGGYGFNVYDAAGEWEEVDHFTSGQLAGLTDRDAPEAYGYAKARMLSSGFTAIE